MCVSWRRRRRRRKAKRNNWPNVAAIISHYVGMFAALYDDNFLLDDGEIVLCGSRDVDYCRCWSRWARFTIEPDESLTRFHLDDLDGCQFSILFVSRLMVVKVKGHMTVGALSTPLTAQPGAASSLLPKIRWPFRNVMPKKFHFSSLFSYCEQTLFRGEMQLNVLLLVVVENMYSAPSVRLMADSCVYVCVCGCYVQHAGCTGAQKKPRGRILHCLTLEFDWSSCVFSGVNAEPLLPESCTV